MTLFEQGIRQLSSLSHAIGIPSDQETGVVKLFQCLSQSWGDRQMADPPPWSAVTDDCSPYEFSVAISPRGFELRMLAEAQSDPASPASYWEASMRLNQHLAESWGADLGRLNLIESLFTPTQPVWFAAMHGVVLWPLEAPLFKIYLNPAAQGCHLAARVVESALIRLGFGASWSLIETQLENDGVLQGFSLDLSSEARARIKIYVRFPAATPKRFCSAIETVDPKLAACAKRFIPSLFGQELDRLPRPPMVVYTLRSGSPVIASVTCQIGSFPFAGTDEAICRRVAGSLSEWNLDAEVYRCAVAAMAETLDSGDKGIHNHISIQREGTDIRVTIYLCPCIYLHRFGAIGFDPPVAWPSPVGSNPRALRTLNKTWQ